MELVEELNSLREENIKLKEELERYIDTYGELDPPRKMCKIQPCGCVVIYENDKPRITNCGSHSPQVIPVTEYEDGSAEHRDETGFIWCESQRIPDDIQRQIDQVFTDKGIIQPDTIVQGWVI